MKDLLCLSGGARVCVLAVLAMFIATARAAHAQCPTVINVPQDAATIDAAVALVCPNTAAEIVVGPGTWTASIASATGSSTVVRGSGIAETTVTPATVGGQFVTNTDFFRPVRFRDCTLVGGAGDQRATSLDHCAVQNSAATFFPEYASVVDTTFTNCAVLSYGVVYLQTQSLVARCTFHQCSKALILWGDGGVEDQLVQDCTFTSCTGPAIEVKSSCCSFGTNRSRIERCTFNNAAGGSGRAIVFTAFQAQGAQTPLLDVVDCTFVSMGSQSASLTGGAIQVGVGSYTGPESSTTITGCSFTECRAGTGGAIFVAIDQPVTLTGCTFTGNSATAGSGGAVAQEFGGQQQHLTATNCSFVGNTASANGGAIKIAGWSGAANLSSCSFLSNTASFDGGAIDADRCVVALPGCVFNANTSAFAGGAFSQTMGSTAFTDCSFTANNSPIGGAVRLYSYNASTIEFCSFVGNTGAAGAAIWSSSDCTSVIESCSFEGTSTIGEHALGSAGAGNSVSVATSTFCASGIPAWEGSVTDAGGNCVVASCADSDNNGTPDECQVVSVPGDYKTIQSAINATPTGEFRIVSVAAGTYAGPIQFNGKAVVVRGAGANATILQGSGGATSSVVRFTGGEPSTAALEGVTVRGGITGSPFPTNPTVVLGGGVFGYYSAASIRNCIIEQNASGFGGGAYMWQCTGQITDTIFRQNEAIADGGGVQIYGGAVSMIDTTVIDNYANSRGGGMHLVEGQPTLTRVSILDNLCNNVAGGLSWVPQGASTSSLTLSDCTVTGNHANVVQGGISIVDDGAGASLHLLGTQVCSNTPVPNVWGQYTADATSEVCECSADITLDGLVNGADLGTLLSVWGTEGGMTPRADCNRDGIVDGTDLGMVLGGWGVCQY